MTQTRMIRLPVYLGKELKACVKVERKLSAKYTKDPSPKIVAADMVVPLAEVKNALSVRQEVVTADAPISGDLQNSLLDCLADRRPRGPSRPHLPEGCLYQITPCIILIAACAAICC